MPHSEVENWLADTDTVSHPMASHAMTVVMNVLKSAAGQGADADQIATRAAVYGVDMTPTGVTELLTWWHTTHPGMITLTSGRYYTSWDAPVPAPAPDDELVQFLDRLFDLRRDLGWTVGQLAVTADTHPVNITAALDGLTAQGRVAQPIPHGRFYRAGYAPTTPPGPHPVTGGDRPPDARYDYQPADLILTLATTVGDCGHFVCQYCLTKYVGPMEAAAIDTITACRAHESRCQSRPVDIPLSTQERAAQETVSGA